MGLSATDLSSLWNEFAEKTMSVPPASIVQEGESLASEEALHSAAGEPSCSPGRSSVPLRFLVDLERPTGRNRFGAEFGMIGMALDLHGTF